MRQANENWSEFDWELALRESDEYAEQYFKLLQRFCDLPDSEKLIAKHMDPGFLENMPDYGFSENDPDWDGVFDVEEPNWGQGFPPFEPKSGSDEDGENEDAQALFYETHPTFAAMRQATAGWCNVYAVILPAEKRKTGLQALYYMGRALANLAYSIEDGTYETPAISLALAKRSLASLNQAVGVIDQIGRELPDITALVATIRDHLIRCADGVADHICMCRKKLKESP
ncbi:MAG: hypothetical protein KAI66_20265 [Lentisphaeria bacterium]|nr:hypothetical protein [Lentisphaeria bacterium]